MITINCEQGSPEWFDQRAGVPSASNFKRIFTGTGKPASAAGQQTYMFELIAEWMGAKEETFKSEWMQRGNELESQAVSYYEFQTDNDVTTVGTVFKDARREISCSPDGLIGEQGGLEIKCPKSLTHVKYLLSGKVPSEYIPQVQGSMYVTGRKWWDFLSFHPDLPPLLIRVKRDDVFIRGLAVELSMFIKKRDEQLVKLTNLYEAA